MSSHAFPLFDPAAGQGARQLAELGLALVLSTLIGAERAVRQKSAGLRTHTLVGVGSALFMEVSQHGFNSVLGLDGVSFDPSRVAAQIVSGIGFIGGGLIFVRRDAVRGLTTAATVWLTCAIGMACGGGLPLLALAATACHFLVARGYPWLTRRVPLLATERRSELHLAYRVGGSVLTRVLEECTGRDFRVVEVRADRGEWPEIPERPAAIAVRMQIEGSADVPELVAVLAEFDGVLDVGTPEAERDD
ncbi:MgtC/SapB family protein [Streptomyces sp. NPDC050095]|uniref:MgtC/SapB family protein n=1 Tax=unclassified Streptomyces TaxID=2593676 RepID=UPI003439A3CD